MTHSVIERIIQRAVKANKRIVLPESEDTRVLQAAGEVLACNYAKVVLLGDEDKIKANARQLALDLSGAEVVNHLTDGQRDRYVEVLYEQRKHKGMTRDNAEKLLQHPVYYGGAMVGQQRADGMVAGSNCPTRDTIRSALFSVGCAEGNKTISACSIVVTQVPHLGMDGSLIFADPGVVPEPTAEQLADIAVSAAAACLALLGVEPIVAMLSFSTRGSAYSPSVQKVINATRLAQAKQGQLKIDGELQLDAALVEEVAQRKAKGSPVAGRANTLIFPDLSCGNIAYKLVERLGGAMVLGPLLMGLTKPINDISRGCKAEDIALVAAITAVQAI